MSTRADPVDWAGQLGAGWFLDWGTRAWGANQPIEYWQMIRITDGQFHPAIAEIQELAREHAGMVWVVGNEPDNRSQDNIAPELYADLYDEAYTALKAADPSALVAVGAVTQASPLRFVYLQRVLDRYREVHGVDLPADWWTVHAYVLREEVDSWGAGIPAGINAKTGWLVEPSDHGNLTLFSDELIVFRGWMKAQGYQHTPLAVTEFGILLPDTFGYTPEVVGQYLWETFTWLDTATDPHTGCPTDEYRLVQRWAWFSLADANFPVADLADLKSMRLSSAGEAFQRFTRPKVGN